MPNRRRSMNFEKLIAKGENAKGFTSQTANGTAHTFGTGWNRDEPTEMPQVKVGGPWQDRRSTRTGE